MSTRSRDARTPRLPLRSRAAVGLGKAVAAASKVAHLGSGSVIGGRASLLVDGRLLAHLTAGHEVAVVSATNGKTTTTRMLAAALQVDRSVATNLLGANMLPGHVAALGGAKDFDMAVLEVDERWMGKVLAQTPPATVLILNLSRDQLDRSHEVRKIADAWRADFTTSPPRVVVANADDPLVVWAALDAPRVIWVGTGSAWRADATGCPACSGRLEFDVDSSEETPSDPTGTGWRCTSCDFARPDPDVELLDDTVAWHDTDRRVTLALKLPGRANLMNAAMALAAAADLGVDSSEGAAAMSTIDDVAGRYREAIVDGTPVRLLLAKNPAGWAEALDMLAPAPRPVVVSINARVADGHDPSWLWDVPFERLGGRFVIAAGERRHDLAVRLQYAEVDHVVADSLDAAVRAARVRPELGADTLDVAANYTAFQGYLGEVGP